jgi:hypothetical protein
MKVWPFGGALRGVLPNHRMLRWLKTVVVSDAEKAHVMRQVGTRKTVRSPGRSGVAVEVSKSDLVDVRTEAISRGLGMSPAGVLFTGRAASGM